MNDLSRQAIESSKVGVVSANPKGFGFISTEDGGEFFVPPALMRTLLPGDRVAFDIEPGNKPGQFQAARPRLVERKPRLWLGTVALVDGYWRLEPDEPCFVKMNIKDVTFLVPGAVVAVRIAGHVPVLTESLNVTLERVLGERHRKGFDVDYALAKHDFAPGFSPAALAQASRFGLDIEPMELLRADRKNLRDLPFVTIDGESTRDFDDAVYARKTGTGTELYVAIADVSHYVKPGSPLDHEAQRRATSVYLPGKTVPMLPEALSNGLCSLNPGVDRLSVVVQMQLSETGEVTEFKYYRAIIQSKARLTYGQVTDMLEKQAAFAIEPAVLESLVAMHGAFLQLISQRKARGVMGFEDAEPKLVVTEDGELSLSWEYRTMAHKLVEELMLLTNRCVAKHVFEKYGEGLFRHQPLPSEADWSELSAWCATRGLTLSSSPSLLALADLIASAASPEESAIVDMRVRQVMQQALYCSQNTAHFSLGFESYTHFTSPIRRHADLVVHRLLLGTAQATEKLPEVAEKCSERARSARQAERQVWDRLKKRILAREVPKDTALDAKIVTMNRRGLRVVIEAWQCAAWIPADVLLEEGYVLESASLTWKKDGKSLEPGVRLTVRWTHLDEGVSRTELQAALA